MDVGTEEVVSLAKGEPLLRGKKDSKVGGEIGRGSNTTHRR